MDKEKRDKKRDVRSIWDLELELNKEYRARDGRIYIIYERAKTKRQKHKVETLYLFDYIDYRNGFYEYDNVLTMWAENDRDFLNKKDLVLYSPCQQKGGK